MYKSFAILFVAISFSSSLFSQKMLTPEMLWKLGRVSGLGVTKDGKYIAYSVSTPDAVENKSSSKTYLMPGSRWQTYCCKKC